jgi:hypothetical protein
VYVVRRVLTAAGFGLVVLAVAVVARSRASVPPPPDGPVVERNRQVRLLVTAAALGLALAAVGVVFGWVLGPGQSLPQVPK